jgi:hypothetical protein
MSTVTSPFEAYAAHYARVARETGRLSSEMHAAARRSALTEAKDVTRSLFWASCVLADQHREALRLVAKLDGAAAWDTAPNREVAGPDYTDVLGLLGVMRARGGDDEC